MRVYERLLEHGSITVAEAQTHLGMDAINFRVAVRALKKVVQIKSEPVDNVVKHMPMRRHSLIREPRPCNL